MSASVLETTALEEPFIVTHGQVGLKLAHRIKDDPYHNQQAGTAEELGDHERNVKLAVKEHGEKCKHKKEDCTAGGDPGHGYGRI